MPSSNIRRIENRRFLPAVFFFVSVGKALVGVCRRGFYAILTVVNCGAQQPDLAVSEENRFYDLFFVYHPDDVSMVRRIAAQLSAMGSVCRFEEDDFRKNAADIGELKDGVLRSHSVGVVLSPASAASQLCNELIQHAVNNSKRIVSLILDEEIDVEVHPAIADNPYVFFRERDDLAERVDELRQYLNVDHETRLHTELLVAADSWQRRGRRPSQLLPPERVAAARQWLMDGSARALKPSPLMVEFIHSSRRQRQPSASSFPRAKIGLAVIALIVLALGFFLLRAALAANQAARAAAAQTEAAQTQLALTDAAATAASDSALSLVDSLAATSERIGVSVNQTAQAVAAAATWAVFATETAQAVATVARATEIYEQARDADAARLVAAAVAALDKGDTELALALAWVAKDALDNPKPAYRVLRRAASFSSSATLEGVTALRFQPGGERFAVLADAGDSIRIYESSTWSLLAEVSDQEARITQLEYSPDGSRLVSASSEGEVVIRAGANGAAAVRISGHAGAVTAVAFHPAGDRFYSAGLEPMIAAWDIESGEALDEFSPETDPGVAIDALLVAADGGRIIGWGSEDGKRAMLQWDADSLESIDTDNGELVYRDHDAESRYGYSGGRTLPAYPGDPNTGDLIIWDLSTGAEIVKLDEGFNWSLGDLTAPSDDLLFISFHDDVALLGVESSDGGQRAALISLEDGSTVQQYDNELARSLRSAEFVDRQTALSLTRDSRTVIWSLADGSLIREVGRADEDVADIRFSAAANSIIGFTDGSLTYLWRMDESWGDSVEALPEALPGSGISPSGETLLLLSDTGLRLIALETGETKREISAQVVSQRGAFVAASDGGRVSLYDIERGDEPHSWSVDSDRLQALHVSAAGEWLLAEAEGGSLWLLGRERDEPLKLDAGDSAPLPRVRFSADGKYMLSLHHSRAIVWDLGSGQALGRYDLNVESVAAVDAAFGAGGDTLTFFVQLESGLASLSSVTIPENVAALKTYIGVAAGNISRDGQALMLVLHAGGARLIDATNGELMYTLPQAIDVPSQWQYLPEAGLLVTAVGRELSIWDVRDGELDQRFAQSERIADFSVSGDGRLIVTRDAGGMHRLLQVESPPELLRRIEAKNPPRELTCAERVHYLVLPLCE